MRPTAVRCIQHPIAPSGLCQISGMASTITLELRAISFAEIYTLLSISYHESSSLPLASHTGSNSILTSFLLVKRIVIADGFMVHLNDATFEGKTLPEESTKAWIRL